MGVTTRPLCSPADCRSAVAMLKVRNVLTYRSNDSFRTKNCQKERQAPAWLRRPRPLLPAHRLHYAAGRRATRVARIHRRALLAALRRRARRRRLRSRRPPPPPDLHPVASGLPRSLHHPDGHCPLLPASVVTPAAAATFASHAASDSGAYLLALRAPPLARRTADPRRNRLLAVLALLAPCSLPAGLARVVGFEASPAARIPNAP